MYHFFFRVTIATSIQHGIEFFLAFMVEDFPWKIPGKTGIGLEVCDTLSYKATVDTM